MDIDYPTAAWALLATFFLAIIWYTLISPIRKGRAKAAASQARLEDVEEYIESRKQLLAHYEEVMKHFDAAYREVDLAIRLYDKKEQVARRSIPRLRRLGKI